MKKFMFLSGMLVVTLLLSSVLGACAPTPVEKQEWKFLGLHPAGTVYLSIQEEMVTEIYNRTDGQIKITIYPAGELPYTGTDALKVVGEGLTEMGELCNPYLVGEMPIMVLPDFPYLALTPEELKIVEEIVNPLVRAELDERNIVTVGQSAVAARQLFTREPVSGLQDLKGLKIRVAGGLEPELVKAWGATPVTILWGELYTAMQRGIVDGMLIPALAVEQTKLYEVTPYCLKIEGEIFHTNFGINKDTWNALPKDVQEIILEAGAKMAEKYRRMIVVELETEALQRMIERGQMQVTEVPVEERQAIREQMLPAFQAAVQKAGPVAEQAFEEILTKLDLK